MQLSAVVSSFQEGVDVFVLSRRPPPPLKEL